MTVRPFDWRDLPALHRFRNQCLFFDSTRLLTRGPRLIPARALFSYFTLGTDIYMYQSEINGNMERSLLGQIIHPPGKACARLAYLTPASSLQNGSLQPFIEHVIKELGQRGATHLLAEVEETDQAFEALRKAGFATYARQRIWKLTGELIHPGLETPWKVATDQDIIGIRSLYSNLVPNLVQQVEQAPNKRINGMIYREANDLLAFVDIHYGPRGVMLQPFIHPDVESVPQRLVDLIQNLPVKRSRPIYIRVRSYQSWLEHSIESLGVEPGPRHAVMVRHLAVAQKHTLSYVSQALERGRPEVSAPITRRIIKENDTTSNYR
jgi:hypothetical protein